MNRLLMHIDELASVRFERYRARFVCPQNASAGGSERIERDFMRMPILIVLADGYDSVFW